MKSLEAWFTDQVEDAKKHLEYWKEFATLADEELTDMALRHDRQRRKLLRTMQENGRLKKQKADPSQVVAQLQAELTAMRAELNVYRGCCSRAFDIWSEQHPESHTWSDGSLAIVEVMNKLVADAKGGADDSADGYGTRRVRVGDKRRSDKADG